VLYDVTRKPEISPKQIPVLDDAGLKIVTDADGNRHHRLRPDRAWELAERCPRSGTFRQLHA